MSEQTQTTPASSQQQNPAPRRHRHRHRGPRGEGSAGQNDQNTGQPPPPRPPRGRRGPAQERAAPDGTPGALLAPILPSQPQSAEPSSADVSANEGGTPGSSRGGRGGRGPRGQQSGNASRQNINTSRTFQGRKFGGQLTTADPGESSSSGTQLQADAPEFTPGQPHGQRAKSQKVPIRNPKRRMSKSTAPDIATRIHEDIDNAQYECAICTNEVLRNSKIWSCRTCWTVFHLGCVKKWASNEISAAARNQEQSGDLPPPRQWRCPGCNLPKDTMPTSFTCWCEKEVDPRSFGGLPPFSCGQTCSRPHIKPKGCPHPHDGTCHAGPCPPCPHMGPTQACFCGKQQSTRRCVDTDYENGWSCGAVCGELMPCGIHYCERPCHEGLCGACEIRVDARCYCGQVEKSVICCENGEERKSRRTYFAEDATEAQEMLTEDWLGSFECGNTCSRPFDCGKHQCEKLCHPQDESTPHCPRSPDVVTTCPCGKTPLTDISELPRQSCEDAIPHCSKPCSKPLACGHTCQTSCHGGDCPPCFQRVSVSCRCGRTTSSSLCHQGNMESPLCMRVCRTSLNCGRHSCEERCCPGERKAIERQQSRRKHRPIDSTSRAMDDGFEAEHICTRTCGRPLKCGNHSCQELDHKGACGSCREAIFDEISCNCGRTVLQPPLPCGTKPPACRFQCDRPKSCGHPQVAHSCHMDDETCPKCPFLTVKKCLCGKNQLKNQPCWLPEARCGELCGALLRCGAHRCRKACHKPGDCEDFDKPCQQACGKEKGCGHPDTDICHSPYVCKEEKPCQATIINTCECQRIKQEAKCLSTRHSEGKSKKTLKCDDECARLERNRKLAIALNIDPETHKDDHIPYSADTLAKFQDNVGWAQTQEREFRVFASSPEEKRLRFKPMPANQRAFLHLLAEDFGLDTESMDPEPHRHVVIFKTPRFVMAPNKTLAECIRIRNRQKATLPVAAAEPKKNRSNVVGDPFNAYVLTNARFGLTIEELQTAIRPALSRVPNISMEIAFLPSEEIVLRAAAPMAVSARDIETQLTNLKGALARILSSSGFGSIQLCRVDPSLNILARESDSTASGGWSQVAANAAPAKKAPVVGGVGVQSGFAVLRSTSSGNKVVLSSKKKKKEAALAADVVDDWEAAELAEEEREKAVSAAGSEDESRKAGGKTDVAAISSGSSVNGADEAAVPVVPDALAAE